MIVTFHIEYRTSWGEEVRILGSVPELGKNNPEQAVALTTVDGIHWSNAEDSIVQSYLSSGKQFVNNCFDICPRQALHAKTLGFVHPRTGKGSFSH